MTTHTLPVEINDPTNTGVGGQFLAAGSPRHIEGKPRTYLDPHRSQNLQFPDTAIPGEVAEPYKRYRGYLAERQALAAEPDTPANTRRRAAFGLLVDDTRRELVDALDAHGATWAARIDELTATTGHDYNAAAEALAAARRDTHDARQVTGWLDRDRVNFVAGQLPAFNVEDASWEQVVADLLTDATGTPTDVEKPTRPSRGTTAALSVRHMVAILAELDMPAEIVQAYTDHRALADRHQAIGVERKHLEGGRRQVEEADRRALADSIRAGKPDPGDRNLAKLDAALADLDRRRAEINGQLRTSWTALWALVDQHRDTWRHTITERHTAAVARYRQAIADVDQHRTTLADLRQTAQWLSEAASGHVTRFRPRKPVEVAGHPWDVIRDALNQEAA